MSISNQQPAKMTIDVLAKWQEGFTERINLESRNRKQLFQYGDALKHTNLHTEKDKCFISTERFLNSDPLLNNDYAKYVSCYIKEGKKLNPKFFRNNVDKLNEYYSKVEEGKAKGEKYNPFNKLAYRNYVLFIALKLKGHYIDSDDSLFNVQIIDNREYNPLTKIPSVLRGELPFNVKEYDIKRAFPTFIDIELNTNHRETIYEKIDKKTFATLINTNAENSKSDITSLRKFLSAVYGADTEKVMTSERFESKGKMFLDLSRHEKEYVEQFVVENEIVDYVRLHDGVFVLQETICEKISFDKVEFVIKECIKPAIDNDSINFYKIDDQGKVLTSRGMYADFLIQEKFKRISTPDDKILLLVNTNNVIDFFNHKTDTVSFLESNINEMHGYSEMVREIIAKESSNVILQSFPLIPFSELVYYTDTKTSFGLPFKNGFFSFDKTSTFEITRSEYTDVKGFFPPHKIQSRDFEYTDEVGMFEQFLTRAAIGREVPDTADTININKSFQAMFGYLCHTYKSQTKSPCIILTDEAANDTNRNGGRGKTALTKALNEVQTQLFKGGKEFDPNYQFVFDDLEKKHKSYVIDDVPAGFKYDDLYTNILSAINCHRKGKSAESIPFEESPKFMITTNWVLRHDVRNASTNRRFLEYKFTDYYNQSHSPKDDFNCTFFEEWDADEWNRFYSFVFKCVELFFIKGVSQIPYNKTTDNFLANFSNDSMHDEFERIITELFTEKESFGVNDFLSKYNYYQNPLKVEKFFHLRNVKPLIEVWLAHYTENSLINRFKYVKSTKKWATNNTPDF
jgi:hypothetical protein